MQPWMLSKRFDLIQDVEGLKNVLYRYKEHLVSQCKRMKIQQQSLEQKSVEDNASLVTLLPKEGGTTKSQYHELEQSLLKLPLYQPLYLNDLAPADRFERRRWLSALCLPFKIMLYRFAYGNNLGTLVYAWRIPEDETADSTAVSRIFSELC